MKNELSRYYNKRKLALIKLRIRKINKLFN